jgi:PAS domain S-box-containing protein
MPEKENHHKGLDTTSQQNSAGALHSVDLEEYQLLFDQTPQGVCIANRYGDILEVNTSFMRMMGFRSKKEMKKINLFRFAPFVENGLNTVAVRSMEKAEIIEGEWPVVFPQGKEIHLSIRIVPLKNSAGEVVKVSLIAGDITLRLQAQKAFRENELKFRKAFKISPDAININRLEDGLYVEINDGFTAITGYARKDILGKTSFEINIWANPKKRDELIKILQEKGFVKDFMARFRLKNGEVIHGLMSANIMNINNVPHILSVTRNVEAYFQANKTLRENEMKFRQIFKTSPDAVAITHRETGLYEDVNDGFLEQTGYKKDEIVGRTAEEIGIWVDIRDRKELRTAIRQKGFVKDFPVLLKLKNGEVVHALVSANTIEINGEPHLLSITRNIEDYFKAAEAYRQSEERYKTLFRLSPVGVLLIDEGGTVLDVNPTYCSNIGYAPHEIIGHKIWNIVDNPLTEKKEAILDYIPHIPEGRIAEKEVQNLRKDGAPLYLHLYETKIRLEDGKKAILSISVDVTEEKKYREELKRQAERLKEAQEIGRLGSWELFWKTRRLSWSEGIYAILELDTSAKPDYGDFQRHIHPDDLAVARKVLKDSIRTGKPFQHVHRLLLKNNKIKWVNERGKTFYDKKGNIIRTHGTVQDITRLKEIEDQLKEFNEKLEEKVRDRTAKLKKKQQDLSRLLNDMQQVQEKLRYSNHALQNLNHELEAFSYSVSHDLKAPLRAIRGFANILKEDYYQAMDKEGRVLVDDILSEAKSMAEIIDALLQLSRTGRKNLNRVEFDLNPLAASVFMEQQKRYNLPYARLDMGDIPPVFADYTLVKQLLTNLISNALKYSADKREPVVEIDYFRDEKSEEPVFTVKDNGVGFDEASAGKIFEAFTRLHNRTKYDGTGIGLAIALRIVTRHGGKIWAKSKKGEGATFLFTLPAENQHDKHKP